MFTKKCTGVALILESKEEDESINSKRGSVKLKIYYQCLRVSKLVVNSSIYCSSSLASW